MFKRRKPQPVHHRVGNLIWPRIGFRRSMTYIWHRVARLHGTPHSIAGGFAAGAAVSFTPFVGSHFVLAAILAWVTRSNVVAGLIGTAVGNPWTFPFIWFWVYEVGRKLGAGGAGHAQPDALAIIVNLPGVMGRALLSFDVDWAYLNNLWAVLWPMIVGSIPTSILVWLAFYLSLRPVVATYQHKRIERRRRKHDRLRAVSTHQATEADFGNGADDTDRSTAAEDEVAKEARG
jgi:uncharacterized protein (DUF2062 family)